MRKAFTFIELIVVIIFLSVLGIIIFTPSNQLPSKRFPTTCYNGVLYFTKHRTPTSPVYTDSGSIQTCKE